MTPKERTRLIITGSVLLWLVCLSIFLTQSRFERSLIFTQFVTGAKLDDIRIKFIKDSSEIPEITTDSVLYVLDTLNKDSLFIVNDIPERFSLHEYTPEVQDQFPLPSCVSWSSAYAGLTILKRTELGNSSHPAFDPMDLHARLKKLDQESPCHLSGANIAFALNLLKNKGCPTLRGEVAKCQNINPSVDTQYPETLFAFESIDFTDISMIKKAIANKMPIVFAINCYKGDYWANAYYDESGVWSGHYTGGVSDMGHAMCLIGFDDNLSGGAFEIMNSWSPDWGKNGFFWIKYTDFQRHVTGAFALYANKRK